MAGHIHTCAHCGHHMQVHERYYGRELRCTNCRNAFVAEAPGEEVPDTVVTPVEEPPRLRRFLVVAGAAAVVVVVLAVSSWWLGRPAAGRLVIGHHGILGEATSAALLVGLNRDTLGEITRLGGPGIPPDNAAAAKLVDSYRAIRLAGGTRVEVLTDAYPGDPVMLRVVSGPWTSKKVWALAEWVEVEGN